MHLVPSCAGWTGQHKQSRIRKGLLTTSPMAFTSKPQSRYHEKKKGSRIAKGELHKEG